MLFLDENRDAPAIDSEAGLKTPIHPGSAALRRALRGNIVCFPSRIPILLRQPPADMQWRMVLLFFVRGWSSAGIAARFHVPKHRIKKSLNEWSFRALALGYVQIIDPDAFTEICQVDVEYGTERDGPDVRTGDSKPAAGGAPGWFPAVLARGGTPPEGRQVQSVRECAEVVGALDAAIDRCDQWRGQFRVQLAAVPRAMRTVAVAVPEASRPGEPPDGLFAAISSGESGVPQSLPAREERAAHAVI